MAPRVENGHIVWRQMIGTTDIRNGDLCLVCERACRRREMLDSGEAKNLRLLNKGISEQKPCWDKGGDNGKADR